MRKKDCEEIKELERQNNTKQKYRKDKDDQSNKITPLETITEKKRKKRKFRTINSSVLVPSRPKPTLPQPFSYTHPYINGLRPASVHLTSFILTFPLLYSPHHLPSSPLPTTNSLLSLGPRAVSAPHPNSAPIYRFG